jgi:hypothetical protein
MPPVFVSNLSDEPLAVSVFAQQRNSQPDYVTSLANFLFSPNRLNVAVSRARRKAIVISSPYLFDVLPLELQGIMGRNLCKGLLGQGHNVFMTA